MQGCFVLEQAWRRGSEDIASCTCGSASVLPRSTCRAPVLAGARRQPPTCLPSSAQPFIPQQQPRNCARVYSKKIIYQVDISCT